MKQLKMYVVLMAMALGCGIGPTIQQTLTPTPTFAPTPPPNPPRPPLVIQYCNDASTNYPRDYFATANRFMSNLLANSVGANQQGVTFYATAITQDTFAPIYTIYPAFTVPPLPAYPSRPTPVPTAESQGPVTDPPTETAIAKQDQSNIKSYNQQVADLNKQIASTKSSVLAQANKLLSWNPARPSTGDVLGCFGLAAQRFAGQQGQKIVYIASRMENDTNLNLTSALVANKALRDVVVHVVYFLTVTADEDMQKRAHWCSYLAAAGARAVIFNDAYTSQQLESTDLFTRDSQFPVQGC